MNIFTRTFVILSAACLLATILSPAVAGDGRDVDRPIEISDMLAASSHEQLTELAVVKMHALAGLLGAIANEDAARDQAPAAERYCLEVEMLQARMRMVERASADRPHSANAPSPRYVEAERDLDQQIERIAAIPPIAQHLRAVTLPRRSGQQESDRDRFALDAKGQLFDEPAPARPRLH